MKIALIQQRASDDREANRRRGEEAVQAAASQGAQVVCFAELAFERFYPQEEARPDTLDMAEPVPGQTTERFSQLARELGVVIVLNLFEGDGERTWDTSPVIDADGTLLGKTRMVHITDYPCFHEKGFYAPGDRGAPVYDTQFGRIGVAICYDRHFPEYMRALALGGAKLVPRTTCCCASWTWARWRHRMPAASSCATGDRSSTPTGWGSAPACQ